MILKLEKIKNSIDTFNDAEFVSLSENPNEIIIKSLIDESLWTINYTEDNNQLIFDTKNAQKIKEGVVSEKEQYKEIISNLFKSLKNVFSENFENALIEVKEYIRTLPKEIPIFEQAKEENEYKFEGKYFTALKANIEKYYEAKKDFFDLGNLFDNNEIKRDKFVDPLILIESLNNKNKASEKFLENIELFVDFNNKITKLFENEEIAKFIISKINFSNPKVSIPKALVLAKKQFNENFNIAEKQKEILSVFDETFNGFNFELFIEGGGTMSGGEPVPFVYNQIPGMPKMKFLKFRTGAFSEEDLNTLQKEIQHVMSRYSELSPEELKIANEMSTSIAYMQLTGQINDQVIIDMIENFNRTFKKRDDYFDPNLQLGFKSASERDSRNFNKGTSNVKEVV